jgi:hypothetical protein
VAAICVLTFADTAGALIGCRYGHRRYQVFGSAKSFEGSAAVLIVAAICVSVSLHSLAGFSWPRAFAVGLIAGAIGSVVEALCSRGLDNLILPIAIVAVLELQSALTFEAALIALWIVVPLLAAGLVHVAIIKAGWFPKLAEIPLDFGATFAGRTWFGENKTVRGALVMIGASAACVAACVVLSAHWDWPVRFIPLFARTHPLIWGALAGAGYIAGELPNSFLKRRLGIAPGAPGNGRFGPTFWFADQIDSTLGVVAFLLPVWQPTLAVVIALLAWTLCVHPLVAFLMLGLGLKTRIG